MTQDEFIANIVDFDDLLTFCYENGYGGYVENIYYSSDRDELINETIYDRVHDGIGWQDIKDELEEIPNDSDWYRLDDYGNWEELDDYDLEDLKADLVENLLDEGFFEDEDEDSDGNDDDEEIPRNDVNEEILEQGHSIDYLFGGTSNEPE